MHRLILLCLLLPLSAHADCFDTATTQLEMNSCAAEKYKKADAELNQVYKAVLEEYKDDALFIEKLRAAQRAWLAYRDAEVEAKFPRREGEGSAVQMCIPLLQAQLTEERIKALREWLDGGEEGDICG
ncbi:MAG TPA: lysozyme inhibitor LprI family protein [Thermoanaerobaculia bacterium]|nr:lysozyme inhibitor LprI family protein [Thermoanaerobaculia bacterium]